ncbi:23S rRNA (adenine(1618)-N(6))-methyltransferase RlmF [Parachlamydia acanthamoebae]|jgi:23S rRNA (adenine1618-N6)-methyltransferase|uniref:23S rRNA (adenine(1618)-N(6))-methyltransferase RlmF n=1 Tax=Parachlamydia acanthamoebae TaxID=83552 RepID=UPI000750D6C0|nr:23S rRNA (adenine(1618)-N(6))-methyltransferase RlmF [Parachlamydia acanthamoebae]
MAELKTELHLRNRHREPYDFKLLIKNCSDLAKFVATNSYGNESIDFTNPIAVKILNKAILRVFYNITWDIPEHFLCPPIPGRADYVHYIADLLGVSNRGIIPQGKKISILDIGVGANCIYPLIGYREYGWNFVGTDIDPRAISIANGIIKQNNLTEAIEIRLQKSSSNIFKGILSDNSAFDVSMCNPPFHATPSEARAGTKRKWKNLRIKTDALNFGGQSNELWCPGGEVAFIKRMIEESIHVKCKWFTTLVSKASSLSNIYQALEKVKPLEVRTINMGQGQKKSRIVAWTFI